MSLYNPSVPYIHNLIKSFIYFVVSHLASSKFQPVDARRAFPCFDEPNIKAEYTITLVHRPNYVALSNMPSTVRLYNGFNLSLLELNRHILTLKALITTIADGILIFFSEKNMTFHVIRLLGNSLKCQVLFC